MNWNLDTEEYPDCCGVIVICNFPHQEEYFDDAPYNDLSDDDGNYHRLSMQQKQKLKDCITRSIKSKIDYWYAKGMFQVILNNWQNRRFGAVVKSLGFKMKQSLINPNTDNKLFYYHLVVRQPGKKSLRKRKFS